MFLGMKSGGNSALTPEQEAKLNKIIVKENYANYDEAINNIDNYNVDDIIFLKNDQGNYDDGNYKQGGYYKKINTTEIQPIFKIDEKNLTEREIIDNLTSDETKKVLSAKQGKEIDTILTKIYTALGITKSSDKFSGFSGNVLTNDKNLVEILQTMADKLDKEVDYVNTYDDLSNLNKNDYVGKIVNVRNSQGSKILGTYKQSGFYRTDGSNWIFAGTNIDDKENKFRIFSTLDDANGQKILGEQAFIITGSHSLIYYNSSSSIIEFNKDNVDPNFKLIGKDYEEKIENIEKNIDIEGIMRLTGNSLMINGNIKVDSGKLTLNNRTLWIPAFAGGNGHVQLDPISDLDIPGFNIVYLRLTDNEILGTEKVTKTQSDLIIEAYSNYTFNRNDLILCYKNGDTGEIIFANGLATRNIKKTQVFIQHDTRSGCPANHAADTDINKQTIEIKHKSLVRYDVETIGRYSSRFDVRLVVDGNYTYGNGSARHLTSTTDANWKPVHRSWTGILEAGTHTFSYRCDKENVIGCGKNRGLGRVTVIPI